MDDGARIDGAHGLRPRAVVRAPGGHGQRHAVEKAARGRLGAVEVAVGVEPHDRRARGTHSGRHAERHVAVAAGDERQRAGGHGAPHGAGEDSIDAGDGGEFGDERARPCDRDDGGLVAALLERGHQASVQVPPGPEPHALPGAPEVVRDAQNDDAHGALARAQRSGRRFSSASISV